MPITTLSALSPLDGRYASRTDKLRPLLSEAGFMHHRVKVEIAWLQALAAAGLAEIKPFSSSATALLDRLATAPVLGTWSGDTLSQNSLPATWSRA